MTYQTHRRWWTVADAARLLRVHTDTLYDACKQDDFPHRRLWDGGPIQIPCEAIGMEYVPDAATQALLRRSAAIVFDDPADDPLQLQLPLQGLKRVRVWRNTGRPIERYTYEHQLWGHNQR